MSNTYNCQGYSFKKGGSNHGPTHKFVLTKKAEVGPRLHPIHPALQCQCN